MFKVVLTLKSLSIRLRECECDIILHKNKQNLALCSNFAILQGNCLINSVRQFYVDADDSGVKLMVYLHQGGRRHFGGEVELQVFSWEENVIHWMESKLNNSPDKNSCITFSFYYFKDPTIIDRRPIFMLQQRHQPEYNIIENSNRELNREKIKLEEEVYTWYKKNEALESGRQNMAISLTEREHRHRTMVSHCQQSINTFSQELERERERKEGLMKLVEGHGLKRNTEGPCSMTQ